MRSRVTFRTIATEWETTVLPMYKHSTQKHRRFMLKKHLLPRFGDKALCEITRQEIQVFVAHLIHQEYAPESIDHVHDVLSAILRTAVKWGHIAENPARGMRPHGLSVLCVIGRAHRDACCGASGDISDSLLRFLLRGRAVRDRAVRGFRLRVPVVIDRLVPYLQPVFV